MRHPECLSSASGCHRRGSAVPAPQARPAPAGRPGPGSEPRSGSALPHFREGADRPIGGVLLMNVLALYDIHGNLDALEAVLADPPDDVEAIVVGGDRPGGIRRGVPDPAQGADAARSLAARQRRAGGRRRRTRSVDRESIASDAIAELTAAQTAGTLDADAAAWLGALPTTIELDGVLYCHATPRRDDEMLTRNSPDAAWRDALTGVDATSSSADTPTSKTIGAPGACASSMPAALACRTRATPPPGGHGSARWARAATHRLRRRGGRPADASRRLAGPALDRRGAHRPRRSDVRHAIVRAVARRLTRRPTRSSSPSTYPVPRVAGTPHQWGSARGTASVPGRRAVPAPIRQR